MTELELLRAENETLRERLASLFHATKMHDKPPCHRAQLNEMERHWIGVFRPIYNGTPEQID